MTPSEPYPELVLSPKPELILSPKSKLHVILSPKPKLLTIKLQLSTRLACLVSLYINLVGLYNGKLHPHKETQYFNVVSCIYSLTCAVIVD